MVSASAEGARIRGREHHAKWKKQVRELLGNLYAHGMVRGDVNPRNVMSNEASAARVIDSGERYNARFVVKENAETERGDLRAASNVDVGTASSNPAGR